MKRKPTQWERDVCWLAEQPQGRRILARLIVGNGCLAAPISGNEYQAGRESVGHEFLGVLAFSQPGLLLGLLTDIQASNDRTRDDRDDADGADAGE